MPVIGVDNALVKLDVHVSRGNRVAHNVYWYRAPIDPDDTNREDVAGVFAADVLTPMAYLMIAEWLIGDIIIEVVNGTLAPLTVASGVGAGAITGASPMPNYTAFPIRLIRTLKDTRSGYKRIPGVSEEMVVENSFTGATVTAWNAFAPLLAGTLTDTALNTWTPVIVRTTQLGEPIENPAQYVYNPISSAIFINRATTQNSRKPW